MKNPATHYDPFKNMSYDPYNEDISETGYCGTLLSEDFDNSTNDKKYVTCKKCIKLFEKADNEMKGHMQNQVEDIGKFVKFMESEKK